MSQPMVLKCPVCDTVMAYEKHDFYICRVCRHELWPPMPDDEREFWSAEHLFADEQRVKRQLSSPGAGNRSSGRKRRKTQGDWRPWEPPG